MRTAKSKFTLLIVLKFCLAILLGWQTDLKAVEPPQSSWQPTQGKWQPVAPHREDRGAIKVVWLQGTPYEMGYQHGKLLHDEIASLGPAVLEGLRFAGRGLGLSRLAMRRSFPEVVEECRGLAAATEDIGFTIDSCMMVAFGDVYQEIFVHILPDVLFRNGCSSFVVSDRATRDSRLYHGFTYDNNKPIDYWIKNPTVFVRQPQDGIPHVSVTVPGAVWPDSGMNAEGITVSIDAAHLQSVDQISLQGGSNVQVMAQVMKHAQSFAEAQNLMGTWQRMRGNIITIADGKSRQAGVFELTGKEMAVRKLDEKGIVYATNHFVSSEMAGQDLPPGQSTLYRYERYKQLLEPDGAYSLYSKIYPGMMVRQILRDRTNPYTLQKSPLDVFKDNASIGGNGSLRQGVFDPEKLLFWVAGGKVPVPENPFVCFSLGEMLGLPNAAPCESPAIN